MEESGWEYTSTHHSEFEPPQGNHFTELHPTTYRYGDVESFHPSVDAGMGTLLPVIPPQVSLKTFTVNSFVIMVSNLLHLFNHLFLFYVLKWFCLHI